MSRTVNDELMIFKNQLFMSSPNLYGATEYCCTCGHIRKHTEAW